MLGISIHLFTSHLLQAHTNREFLRLARTGELLVDTLKPVQLRTGIERNALHFAHAEAIHLERCVLQFEHHANRAISEHARVDEIARSPKSVGSPETGSAATTRQSCR